MTTAAARLLLVCAASLLGGCVSMYVDGHLPEIPAAQMQKPAAPPKVQLFWEFQTKGVTNIALTQRILPEVKKQLEESGLFSDVSDGPVAGGATLTLTVNNVPLTDDAYSKAFMAGFTFGLAGTTVADGYECTLAYSNGAAGAPSVQQQGKHIIYTSVGTGSPPQGAQKMSKADDAFFLMLRQLLSNVLNDLSKNSSFP